MTALLAFLAGVFVGALVLAAALILLSANHAPPPDPIDLSRIRIPPPSAGVRPRGWSQVHPDDKPPGRPPMMQH